MRTEDVNAVLELPAMAQRDTTMTTTMVAMTTMATGGDDDDDDGELPINHLAMVVAEQGVPSILCGHKTTGDVSFTKWQVMMSDLSSTNAHSSEYSSDVVSQHQESA